MFKYSEKKFKSRPFCVKKKMFGIKIYARNKTFSLLLVFTFEVMCPKRLVNEKCRYFSLKTNFFR